MTFDLSRLFRAERTATSRTLLSRLGAAALPVAAALFIRLALDPVLATHSPYIPFVLAVAIAALLGGRGAGVAATVLSAAAAAWFFLEPRHSLWVHDVHATAGLALYVVTGMLIALLVGRLQAALVSITRAEAALHDQTRLVNLSHDAIIATDAGGRITKWNRGAEELYGWTEAEVLGHAIHDLLRTSSNIPVDQVDAIVSRKGRWEGELRHVARDGRHLWVESRRVLLRDDANQPARVLEINRDVTKRKRAEEAQRESEVRYSALFNSIDEGFCVIEVLFDANGNAYDYRLIEANPAFEKQTGIVDGIGRRASELFPNLEAHWFEIYGEIALTGQPERFESPADALGRYYDIYAFRVGGPEQRNVAVLFNDVTERKRREAHLAFLAELGEDLSHCSSPDEIMRAAGGKIGAHLRIASCHFAEIDEAQDKAVVGSLWSASEEHPGVIGVHRLSNFVTTQYLRAARAGEAVIVSDTSMDPGMNADSYAALGIRSFVTVPFRRDGHWKYLFQVNDPAPREWRNDEIELIREVTNRVFPRIERARAEEALRQALQRYEQQVRLFDGVAATTPDFVFIFDLEGRFLYANRRLLEVWGMNLPDVIGKTCRELGYEQWHHDMHMREIAQVIETKRAIKGEVPFKAPLTGIFGVYEYIFTPVIGPDGEVESIAGTTRDVTERKQAEQALRDSEERFRALAMATSDVVYRMSPDWSEMRHLRGRGFLADTEEPSRTWMEEYVHPDDRAHLMSAVNEAIRTKTKFELEHRVKGVDGSVGWVFSRAIPVRNANGEIIEWFGMASDITWRKQAEEALRESEERLRIAQKVARVGTFEWNIETGVTRWTPDLEAMYGLPRGGFIGTQEAWEQLVHPDDRAGAMRAVDRAFETGVPVEEEWRVIWPDGSIHWLAGRFQIFRDSAGRPLRLAGLNIDITERKRTEEALREASEQRGLALEAANLGAWDYRFDAGEVYWDERCRRMFGFPACTHVTYDEGIARIHPDDRAGTDEAIRQALASANDGNYRREFRVVWPDGSVRWVSSHGRVFFEGDGEQRRAVRFVGVIMDITDRRSAEEALRHQQKLESVGLLAGGVAHDFNNLLTVIMGSASAALDLRPSCEHSKAVLDASERAAHLTKQLLAYAGKAQFVKTTVDLTDLVSGAKHLLGASVPKRVSLAFNLATGLPSIEEDPSRVEQILMNLVINAGEAIPPKTDGRIVIATGACEITPDVARQQSRYEVAPGGYVWLEVCDNGEGITEPTLSRIFDPFFSTKFTGRGLGLAAVDGIVRSGKGFITVRSFPGGGTRFRVFLPASETQRAAEPGAPIVKLSPPVSSTVLVVDDEEMVRKLAAVILRRHGYEVLEAKDGKDALQVIGDSPTLPSVVLLDLAMPVMGGDELIPILAQRYPTLKVVVSSGFPEEDARNGFHGVTVAGFLQKPYTAVTLTNKVDEILGGGPQQTGRLPLSPQ